ncbi:PREDICTED: serine-rich adhesin for platelets-like [Rhagoletis zephyria]|uniref:serine-rich adhesin for platelets-like n=1 Tax=Rhagoletis zephyria TaxID=28612 RepID=UPI000811921F|nr:PREDICTED: serine-rich adhesin for platelets-like [Rhagoletis zephyria]
MSHLDQENIPAVSVSVEIDTSATAESSSGVNLASDCPATAFSPAVQPTTAANEPAEAEDVESPSYKSSDGNESNVDDIGEAASTPDVSNEVNFADEFPLSTASLLSSHQQSPSTNAESELTEKRPLTPTVEQLDDENHCTSKKSKTKTEEMSHLDQENIPAASVSVETDTSATAELSSSVNLAPDCPATAFLPVVHPTTAANEPAETEDVESSSYKSSDGNESKVDDNDEAASPHEVSNEVNFAEEFNLSAASSSSSACQQSPSTNPESESTAKRPLTPTVEQLNDESHCISKKSKSKTEKMSHLDQENIPAASVSVETNTSATAEPSSGVNLAPDCPATAFSPAVQPTTAANEPVEAEDVESSSYKSSDGNESKVDDIGEAASTPDVSNEVNFADEFNLSAASSSSSACQQSPSTNPESESTAKRPLTPTVEQLNDESHCTSKKSKKTEKLSHFNQANNLFSSVSVDAEILRKILANVQLRALSQSLKFSAEEENLEEENQKKQQQQPETEKPNQLAIDLPLGSGEFQPDYINAKASDEEEVNTSPPPMEHLKPNEKSISPFLPLSGVAESFCPFDTIVQAVATSPATHVVETTSNPQSTSFLQEQVQQSSYDSFLINPVDRTPDETPKSNTNIVLVLMGAAESSNRDQKEENADDDKTDKVDEDTENEANKRKDNVADKMNEDEKKSDNDNDNEADKMDENEEDKNKDKIDIENDNDDEAENEEDDDDESYKGDEDEEKDDDAEKDDEGPQGDHGQSETDNDDKNDKEGNDNDSDRAESSDQDEPKSENQPKNENSNTEEEMVMDVEERSQEVNTEEQSENSPVLPFDKDNLHAKTDDVFSSIILSTAKTVETEKICLTVPSSAEASTAEPDSDNENDKNGNDNDSDNAGSSYQDVPKSEKQPENKNNTKEEMDINVEQKSPEVNTEEQSENSSILLIDKDNLHLQTNDVLSLLILSVVKTNENKKIRSTLPSFTETITVETLKISETEEKETESLRSSSDDIDVDDTAKPASPKEVSNGVNGFESGDEEDGEVLDGNKTKDDARFSSNSELDIDEPASLQEVSNEDNLADNFPLPAASAPFSACQQSLSTNEPESESTAKRPLTPRVEQLDDESHCTSKKSKTNTEEMSHFNQPNIPAASVSLETDTLTTAELSSSVNLASDCPATAFLPAVHPTTAANEPAEAEEVESSSYKSSDSNESKVDDNDEAASPHEVSNEVNFADEFNLSAASSSSSACQQLPSTNPESESTAKRPLTPTVEQLNDESHCILKKSKTNTEEMSHLDQENIPAASVSVETDTSATTEPLSSVNLAPDCPATAFSPAVQPTTTANEPAEVEEVEPFSMNVEGSSSSAEVTAVISAEVSGLMAKTLEKTFSSNAVDESGDDSSGDGSDDHHHHQAATEEISHEDHQMPEAKNADSHNNNSLLGARSFIRAGEKLPSPADTVVQEVLSADEVQSLELSTASPTDADASSPSSSPKSPPHPPLSSSSPSSHSFIIPSNLSVQPFHPSSPLFSPLPAAPSSSSSCCILQSPSPEFILATESLRSQTTSSSLSSSSSSSSLTSVDPSILGLLSQSPPSPPSSHSLSSHPSSSSPTIPTSSSSPPPTAAPKSPSSSPSFHHSSSSETSHLRPTPPLSSLKVLPVLPSQEQSNSFGNEQDKLKNKSDDENSKKKAQNILENSSNSEFFSEDKSPECELVIVEKAELATSSSSSLVAAETAVPYVYQENTSPVTQESPSEMENFLQNFWETPDEQKSNDNAHITSNDEGIVVANIMPNVASCVASSSTGFQLSPPLTTTTTTTTTAVLSSAHQMNVHLSLENSTEPLKCFQSNFINSAVLPSTTPENNVTDSGCFLEQRNSKNEIVPEAELSSSSSSAALSLKNSVFQQASSPAQAVEGPSDGENLDEPPIEALAIVQNEQVVVNNEEQAKQSAVNEEVDVLNLNSFFAEQCETVETESFEVPVDRGAILHSEYHQQIFESTFSDMNTSHDSLSVSQSTGTTNSEDILGIAVQASGIISYKEQQNNSNNYGDSMSSFKHPPPLSTAFQQMPQLETQPQLKQNHYYHHHLPLAAAQQTLRTQQQMQQPVHQQQQHQSSGSNVRHRNVPDLFPASAHRQQQQQQQQQQQPQYFPQQQHQQQHPLSQGPSARPLDVLSHLHNSQQGSTSSHGQGSAASHQHQYGHSNGSTLGSGSNGSNGYHQHANQSYPYYPYGAAQGSNAGSKEQLYQNNQYLQYQQYQPQQKESYYSYQNNSSN